MDRRIFVGMFGALSHPAHGAGFAVTDAPGMGYAYAGATARADNAGTVFFNPAGMTWIDNTQVTAEVRALKPSFVFTDEGSSYPLAGGMPVSGDNGGDAAAGLTFIPNLYCTHGLTKNVAIGLGIFFPYGLGSEYDADWVGRYHSISSSLTTMNINPSLAWRVNDHLSLGVGVSAERAEAKMVNAIDFGTVLLASGMAPTAIPQSHDGEVEIIGNDWAYGYNAGLIYALSPAQRFGISFRSRIDHALEGDATFDIPSVALPLQEMNMFVNTDGRAHLSVPAMVSVGYYHKLGTSLALLSDVVWTQWSCFDELRVEYDSNQEDTVTSEAWEDSWRVSIGMDHQLNSQCNVCLGTAYDVSPVPDAEHRSPRIPDSDRIWVTGGAGFRVSKHLKWSCSYLHAFISDGAVDRVGTTGDNLTGYYDGQADLFNISLEWDM